MTGYEDSELSALDERPEVLTGTTRLRDAPCHAKPGCRPRARGDDATSIAELRVGPAHCFMLKTWADRVVVATLTFVGGLSLVFSDPPVWVGLCVIVGMSSAFFHLGMASRERARVD